MRPRVPAFPKEKKCERWDGPAVGVLRVRRPECAEAPDQTGPEEEKRKDGDPENAAPALVHRRDVFTEGAKAKANLGNAM